MKAKDLVRDLKSCRELLKKLDDYLWLNCSGRESEDLRRSIKKQLYGPIEA